MALQSYRWRMGARYFTLSVIVAVAIALFVYQWLPAPPPASAAPLSATPALVFDSEKIPDSIALGESIDLEFQIGLRSGTGDHGGISLSFPDLTARGGSSSSYDSVQGTVTTVSYTNGSSHVAYFDEGDQIFKGNDANRSSAKYLLVESDDDDWPSRSGGDYVWRTLILRVTPKESGVFRIYSRFWLCGSGYGDCDRRPRPEHSDQEDQQRWSVYEDTVRVSGPTSGPSSRNSAEDFDGLDAAGNDSPEGIWSDGTTMWVADYSDDKIYAYNLSTKARDSSKDFDTLDAADNESPTGIWSDRTTMWVADSSDDKIYAYNMSNKARVSSKDFDTLDSAGNGRPEGIWSDGATLWVADSSDDKIYAYNMSNKARVSSKDFDTLEDAENDHAAGIWSDGATMWVADYSDDKIYAYNMGDQARVSSKDFDTLEDAKNDHAAGIWSDGATMWVADYSDEKIYAYNALETAVSNMNRAPTVTGTPPTLSLTTGDSQTFGVSATDADNNMTKWKWVVDKHFSLLHGHQQPEESFAATGSITKTFSHTFPDNGTYTVTVTFTDSDGNSGTAEWRVEVEDLPNHAPTVSRVPSSPSQVSLFTGDRQTFTARASDPDDNLKRYEWFVNDQSEDSGVWRLFLPTGSVDKSFSHTFSTAGPYTVKATFTDTEGESDSAEWTVTVKDPNRAPSVVRGSPSTESVSLETGDRQAFTANASDPDNNLRGYEWFVGDVFGDAFVWQTPPTGFASGSFSHTFSTEGTFIVEASFTDTEGLSGSVTWTVTVTTSNRAPSVTPVSPPSPVSLYTGDRQTFEASASDPDDNLKSYEWFVKDRSEESSPIWFGVLPTGSATDDFSHTFGTAGPYTVKATFTDKGGLSDSVSWTVVVIDPSRPSVTRVSPPQESLSLYTGETQEFIVRATDADNNLAKWKWEAKHYNSTLPYVGLEEPLGLTGSTTKTFSYKFEKAGAWNVTATFTDFVGETGSVTWTVEATDGPDLAIDELELISLKPASEVGALIPPATIGDSFGVELDYRNHHGPASGAYEVSFYFKVPSWELPIELPGPIWDRFDKPLVEPAFNPGTDIPLRPNLPGPSLGVGERKRTGLDVEVPSGIEAGPYWFCAQIEHKEPIPDPREDDNAICIMMYVVSHPEVAEWVHPVDPWDGRYGRIWLGMLYEYFDPAEVSYFIRVSLVEKDSRKQWYRRVALELAARQALETDDYLNWIDGLRDQIEVTGDDAETLHNILTLYGEAQKFTGHAGLSSEVTKSITGVAGPIMSGVNLGSDWADVYFRMIVNRGANLDSALATLKVLEDLPIDEDFPEKENEWREGIQLARQDVHDMLSEDAWKEFSVAAREVSDELVLGSVSFTVSIVAASGLTIKGIALGATAHTIGLYLLPAFLVQAVNTHFDHLVLSFLAAQVYAELYQEDVSGDHLEALTYAKYAAYDHFYESQDGLFVTFAAWVRRHLDTVEKIKEHAAQERDAALEEARSHVQLATIEFNPSHYSLKVGDIVQLEPEFKSGSGKNMVGYGVEWDVTSYDPQDTEVVAIDDTGVVTALRSGEAIIAANIGSVVGGVAVTVTSEYECVNGAVADAANTGLVADCEVLLAARDTLAGTASLNWSLDTPITGWDGVTVGGTPPRVTGLALVQKQLTGEIPSALASLSNLGSLRLDKNQLTGCIPPGLRDVASNDLAGLSLPFCDVLLSGLTVSPGVLAPAFTSYQTAYTAAVGPSPITVTPANAHNAAIAFLDENVVLIPDADGALAGHQVDLADGTTTIKIKVTSQDGKASLTYAIEVTRSGLPAAPAIAGPITPGPASLTVSWTPPAGGTAITSYDLRYIESDAADKAEANWTVEEGVWTVGTLSYTVTGLTGGAQYDVQVRAVTSAGEGPWSVTATEVPTAGATRSFSTSAVAPGGQLVVTITATGYGAFGGVAETVPSGFSYVSSSLSDDAVTAQDQELSFALFGETEFTYTVTAPDAAGPYPFSGILTNSDKEDVPVGGALSVTVGEAADVTSRYDANGNGLIEKSEVIQAINGYLFGGGGITKAEVIRLINVYLFS